MRNKQSKLNHFRLDKQTYVRSGTSTILSMIFIIALALPSINAQAKKKKGDDEEDKLLTSSTVSGLKFRSLGPAYASGRIADFAVNPDKPKQFYVAVACGNIWKTNNNGITFKPVFENYGSYSIGCLAMDPNNHNVIWTGSGENNHQRALGYGDGVYKSVNGGKSWENMGLKNSRQIGMITIDPRNSNVVYVAAEGSVWGAGGDRGLYKTTDGGENWEKILEISENTGINNVIMDPRDSDVLYASSEQRRRHVHTKIGGGPETAIYKSTDGGQNWRKLKKGLPGAHMGGIGLAISPVNPDVVYAIIEAANDAGGFFRSTDRGESWRKMSDHHASGQYYNEIICDPKDVDKVYSMETVSKLTLNGGKTWKSLGRKSRHVDDHALWIDPEDPEHFIIGGDGGVYISYNGGSDFRHVSNLPVTQFYRVAVDNAKPFYNVYGGTQDNSSMGGPSQTLRSDGIVNEEWFITQGGDGFWTRIDPKDPNIVYAEYQYGNIVRYDKQSGESVSIKPVPPKGEKTYKWNWNTPMIISPHSNTRLYMGANKLFRSDNRGNSWVVISPDLTRQIDRNTWKVMGKYWSADAVAKDVSTSLFGMLVSLDESPVKEDLIYVGTDDGLIQVTEDAGKNWRKIAEFPDIPEYTYVSDIYASRFDENVVYASFDNRKRDDFKPYLLKSIDKGESWEMISEGLPENGTVHTIEQDHENPNLLFAGTEFGIFFSHDAGESWTQLKSGIPTIAVRDLAIQERENDLVLATFGRGFYVLDDYSPLRGLSDENLQKAGYMFPIDDALMYIKKRGRYGQGSTYYKADNPDYGAVFTYYLKETPKTRKQIRHKKEQELFKESEPIPQPSWKELRDESKETPPYLIFTISDNEGNVIRKLTKKPGKGIHRINWDLRYESPYPEGKQDDEFDPYDDGSGGMLVMPGTYHVSVTQYVNGEFNKLIPRQSFTVKPLINTTLPAPDRGELVAFQQKVSDMTRKIQGAMRLSNDLIDRIETVKQVVLRTPEAPPDMMNEAEHIWKDLDGIVFEFRGNTPKASREEIPPQPVPLQQRMRSMIWGHYRSTSAVTETEREQYRILQEQLPPLIEKLRTLAQEDIKVLEEKLDELNAPWFPGRMPDWK